MKQKFIEAFMNAAEVFAALSSARRLHVGAIIVKDNRIVSIGYNGMPAGWDNDCEYTELMPINDAAKLEDYPFLGTFWINGHNVDRRYRLRTKPEVLHAETNAIAKLAKSTESGDDATMFITHAPCLDCAKLIYQSGIKSVYYRNTYRNTDGVDFLNKCNIEVKNV
jgi:dCMP deaminase